MQESRTFKGVKVKQWWMGDVCSFKHELLKNQSEPPGADLVPGRLGFLTWARLGVSR